jgi:hypothetical protein
VKQPDSFRKNEMASTATAQPVEMADAKTDAMYFPFRLNLHGRLDKIVPVLVYAKPINVDGEAEVRFLPFDEKWIAQVGLRTNCKTTISKHYIALSTNKKYYSLMVAYQGYENNIYWGYDVIYEQSSASSILS